MNKGSKRHIPKQLHLCLLSDNWADTNGTLNRRMTDNLALVVFQARLGDRTDVGSLLWGWVVGGQNSRDWSDDWANPLIQSLALLIVDLVLESWTRLGVFVSDVGWETRMLVKLVMVIGRGVCDRADKATLVCVKIGVRWREDGVGGADNRANLSRSHFGDDVVELGGTGSFVSRFAILSD